MMGAFGATALLLSSCTAYRPDARPAQLPITLSEAAPHSAVLGPVLILQQAHGHTVYASDFRTLPARWQLSGTPVAGEDCGRIAPYTRPFARLTAVDATGKILWDWHVGRDDVQLLRLRAVQGQDCRSPDGRFLTVEIWHPAADGTAEGMLGEGVVGIGLSPGFFTARTREGQVVGSGSTITIVGWDKAQPSTLLVEVTNKAGRRNVVPTSLARP